MQSAENSLAWLQSQESAICAFTDKIEQCIADSDWDGLAEVLDRRQAFLQQLFRDTAPQIHQASLKRIAESILAEDAVFQAMVEAEKQAIAQQHEVFERSRRALKAYGEQ